MCVSETLCVGVHVCVTGCEVCAWPGGCAYACDLVCPVSGCPSELLDLLVLLSVHVCYAPVSVIFVTSLQGECVACAGVWVASSG